MSISLMSESLTLQAKTIGTALNKKCVLILSLNEDHTMELGYSSESTLYIMGLLGWALTAMGAKCENIDV